MNVTVVIPTRNRAAQLREAVKSVIASTLAPTARDIIVVDDGSEDETPSVAHDVGVRYVRIAGGGPSGSRNAGLRLTESELVAFLDDDDVWLPDNMLKQLEALGEHPGAAFAYGRVLRTNAALEPFGEPIPPPPLPSGLILDFVAYYDLQLGAILFRRTAVEAIGGFDPDLRFTQDSDLLVRLAARYPAVGVDTVGSLFRQRAPNPADAASRWPAHLARVAARRKWRRSGIRISLQASIRSELNYRGMTSFFFCEDAAMALAAGRRRNALTSLIHGLQLSPVHCLLGHRRFWWLLPQFARALMARSGPEPRLD